MSGAPAVQVAALTQHAEHAAGRRCFAQAADAQAMAVDVPAAAAVAAAAVVAVAAAFAAGLDTGPVGWAERQVADQVASLPVVCLAVQAVVSGHWQPVEQLQYLSCTQSSCWYTAMN